MIQNLQKKLAEFTRVSKGPEGTVTVFNADMKPVETFRVPSGLQFDRFVMDQWRNRPREGEVTFIKDWKAGQATVKVCRSSLQAPTETWQLDYDFTPNLFGV